ncbi:MAG TPA: FAD-dependent oxidoreductase [Microbacterium sp.]|nr:FAD-dependent oxidoreductase [Microbacterium sp.]
MSARTASAAPAARRDPVHVVVLGGGYVGVWAARAVVRRLRRPIARGDVRVTIVSASPDHAFHGWTAEVITGHVRPRHASVPLRRLVPQARLVHGVAAAVDTTHREVEVLTDLGVRRLPYDHLVVGIGSRDASDRVPGLRDHGWSVKAQGGLDALTAHLDDVVRLAARTDDPVERRRLLTAVVAGGGLSGIEVAAAVSTRLRRDVAAEPRLRGGSAPRVVLVHSGERPTPDLRPRFDRVADYAAAQAVRAGVELRCDARIVDVCPDGAILDEDSWMPSATVLSALGQTPVPLPGTEDLPRDAAGRLITDAFLRTPAPGVWAGGDVAAVPHPSGRGTCRSDALWAIHHGARAGANVARAVQGRTPRRFRFPGLGRAASFGIGRGAGELYGIPLIGWGAWLPRWVLFHWFMPSRRVALASASEWFAPRRRPAAAAAQAAKRSVAATRAAAIPGSVTEWPASSTTTNSASGHAR